MYTNDLRPEVKAAILATIESLLDGYALDSCSIKVEPDDFGGEGIFIHLDYNKSVQTFDSELGMELLSRLIVQLVDMGEHRFPFIRHHFQPDQKKRA